MTTVDWLGFLGVALILLAYFLNVLGRIAPKDLSFILLNLIGAVIACFASVLLNYIPFIILEGAWALIALISLFNYSKTKKAEASKNLTSLLKNLSPKLNEGDYVYITVSSTDAIPKEQIVFELNETEGKTVILPRITADNLDLPYTYVARWITLQVYSSLEAVGLTAAVSTALSTHEIPCNIVAGYHHDHLFIDKNLAAQAMELLWELAKENKQTKK